MSSVHGTLPEATPLEEAALVLEDGTVFSGEATGVLASYPDRIATGELMVAVAVTEPDFGSDVANLSVSATPAEGGGWLVNGVKTWCTFAARADVLMLLHSHPALDDNEVEPIRALCSQNLRSLDDDPGTKVIYELRRRHFPTTWYPDR